jgi:hypothetical protein
LPARRSTHLGRFREDLPHRRLRPEPECLRYTPSAPHHAHRPHCLSPLRPPTVQRPLCCDYPTLRSTCRLDQRSRLSVGRVPSRHGRRLQSGQPGMTDHAEARTSRAASAMSAGFGFATAAQPTGARTKRHSGRGVSLAGRPAHYAKAQPFNPIRAPRRGPARRMTRCRSTSCPPATPTPRRRSRGISRKPRQPAR